MNIGDLAGGRDNNFNLIRLAAAGGVLVTHSYALVGLPPLQEPLRGLVGISFGTVAVDAFFVTSGFLVTASLLARPHLADFLLARLLRIYPALLMLVLLMLGLGLACTTLPAATFLRHGDVFDFAVRNATLLGGVSFYLPGVFEGNPFPRAVNASLWTLPYEVWLYVSLFAVGLLAFIRGAQRQATIRALVLLVAVGALVAHLANHFLIHHNEHTTRLCLMFYAGAAAQACKERLPLSDRLFAAASVALVLAAFQAEAFFIVYHLLLAYILLYLAYRPGGRIRAFNRGGDYSYGAYLYAFPVQQTVAALVPGIGLGGMLALSAATTLALAMASWHLLEKRALRLKTGRPGTEERNDGTS